MGAGTEAHTPSQPYFPTNFDVSSTFAARPYTALSLRQTQSVHMHALQCILLSKGFKQLHSGSSRSSSLIMILTSTDLSLCAVRTVDEPGQETRGGNALVCQERPQGSLRMSDTGILVFTLNFEEMGANLSAIE